MTALDADSNLRTAVRELAKRAGLGSVASLDPVAGGHNNRSYRARTGRGDVFIKRYFRSPDDPRDRLTAETAFARFAWDRGVRAIPEPLGEDRAAEIAAFAWVKGGRVVKDAVGRDQVGMALDFFESVNRHRDHPQAGALGAAAEACFTIAEHLRLVSARVARLIEHAEEPARTFVRENLRPAWTSLEGSIERGARELGLDCAEPVPRAERCLSPSDFGFHNAIAAGDGARLVFHDFEYAGWDDPAKLVGDFFSQVAVPVPHELEQEFVERVARALVLPDSALTRIGLLRPVFRLKWCCIVLNEFLPVTSRRREFAVGEPPAADRKAAQLGKAEAALADAKASR